ncbi:MAG: NAD(P)/FAD-dependent oxidoreductase [Rickettsiaceae bacterium]
MKTQYDTDIAIVGAGPVGLFSAFQAGMLQMKCHVIDALDVVGGQCATLYPEKPIYDIPAYPEIKAIDLINKLKAQAAPFNPTYHLSQRVVSLKQTENKGFIISTSNNINIKAKILVIAAGPGAFGPNRPPLDGIEDYEDKSVFYFIRNPDSFANKTVVIAGGGDSALDWAIALSKIAKKIYLVHRRSKFRAAPNSIQQMLDIAKTGKIETVLGYQLHSINGKNGLLDEVRVVDLDGNVKSLQVDALCSFFGLSQNLGPINDWSLNIKSHGIEVSQPHFQTNIENIYAIGDIAHYKGKLKLILVGFAEAASVMHHAYSSVFDGKPLHFEYSTTKGIKS